MFVAWVILALLLLLPSLPESHPIVSPEPKKYANLLSKRMFLSPRDLHGSYSRFLELSENSTLCPNTVTHNTNGKLYPSGHIHIPLHDISHDGYTCTDAGELVIRFRRRMKSKEIEHEFNISSDASGIDKMVRDILLSLDGFYFGRQTMERKCHDSHLSSNTAFFFTSQAKPFTAKVGIPFRRNPKIMFLVDKTRVCAFSGSFMPLGQIAIVKHPIPKVPMTPKPPATPSSEQDVKSHTNMMQNETPREMTNDSMQISMPPPHHGQNSLPNTLGSPTEPQRTLAPSVEDMKTMASPHHNRAKQHRKETMKTMTPLLMSGTESLIEGKVHSTTAPKGTEKPEKPENLKQDMFSSYPSPSELPQHNSEVSLSKHQHKSGQPSNRPSSYPTKNSSHTAIYSKPSTSPAAKSYEVVLPSASPRLPDQSSPSMTRPHPLINVFSTGNISPTPSPIHIKSGEGNQPYTSTPQELHGSGPMISQSNLPEGSASDVILGDSSSTCFPSFATVMLSNGRIKRMDELSIGASVHVGFGKSSSVIDFSHSDPTIVSPFMQFQTDSGRNLTVTSSHFVYTDNRIIPAAKVVVGDRLKLSDGRPTSVVKVSMVRSRGLFNPHSRCGHIVVDGFIVSTYTLAAAPMTAHALLAPIRCFYDAGFRTSIVSKLAKQPTIVRAFTSLLSGNIHSTTF